MNVRELTCRLKAELCRNKAKTTVLAVMCLIAAYFWVPLVGKWLFRSDSSADVEIAGEQENATAAPSSTRQAADPENANVQVTDWQTLRERLRHPLMKSIGEFSLTRHPFVNPIPQTPDAADEDDDESNKRTLEPIPRRQPTFAELQLVLNGTLVGQRTRMAQINGVTYREQDDVPVRQSDSTPRDDASGGIFPVQILSIRADRVVVGYGGKVHTVLLEPLKRPDRGSIAIHGGPQR